jgi:hypothetical protein
LTLLFLQPFFYSLAISNASDFFDRIRMSKYARHHAIEKQNPPRDIPRAGWLCEFDGRSHGAILSSPGTVALLRSISFSKIFLEAKVSNVNDISASCAFFGLLAVDRPTSVWRQA